MRTQCVHNAHTLQTYVQVLALSLALSRSLIRARALSFSLSLFLFLSLALARARARSLSLSIYIYILGAAILPRTFQVPCKFHHVGSGCGKKDCLFKHAVLTDEEREWAERCILKSSLDSGFICSKCTRALTSENVWEWTFFFLKRQWQLGSREHMALVAQVHSQQ
jgi:hypothetical protein